MDDFISREDTIEKMEEVDWYHQNKNGEMVHGANPAEHQAWYKVEDVYKVLEDMPSAQPECEKGKWVQKRLNYDNDVWVRWECSRCGYLRKKGWKYILEAKKPEALFCEMCGADMRGEQE